MEAHSLDTSSLDSVRTFEERWRKDGGDKGNINILVHNAEVTFVRQGQNMFTCDGFPLLYATNFLGAFLLTYHLEEHLSIDARVISTTSTGHYGGNMAANFALESIINRIETGFTVPGHQCSMATRLPIAMSTTTSKLMPVAFTRLLQHHFERKANESGQIN